jgi:hypothetical protein
MKLKTIAVVLFAVLTFMAQTAMAKGKNVVWEHPATEENINIEGYFVTLLEITRVEFADEETRVAMHVAQRPDNDLQFVKEIHLLADGKRYAVRSCDGIELNKPTFLTNHGQADVVFHF